MKNALHAIGLLRVLDVVRVWANKGAYLHPGADVYRKTELINLSGPQNDLTNALDLLPEEYRAELISISKSLVSGNENGPHCSGKVSKIMQKCTTGTLPIEDRDEAAMLLTVCDRARDYAPPMECMGLYESSIEAEKSSLKRCVIALDQHQNFQRTFDVYRVIVIPEKCKSLNSIFNTDPYRELYQNVTISLTSLIQALARKEERNEEYFAQWDDHINSFKDVTADISTVKEILAEYNEQFVNDLSEMVQKLAFSLEDFANKGRKVNEELSSELRGEMSMIEEEHKSSLELVISSAEASFSESLKAVLDNTQERQDAFNSAAFLTIDQLMGAAKDLSVARQQFEILSTFVRETTTKAYNQAFLLDAKQHEVADSLAGLSVEIKELSSTTHRLNTSLTDIKGDSDSFRINFNARRTDTAWLNSATLFASFFRYLGLSPLWALSFLLLSLPRFVIEQLMKMIMWGGFLFVSYLMRMLLGHRKRKPPYDGAKIERGNPMSYQTDDKSLPSLPCLNNRHHPLLCIENYATKELSSHQYDKTPYPHIPVPYAIPGSHSDRFPVNEDWTATRTRTRGISRVPERLYAPEPPARFARTRL